MTQKRFETLQNFGHFSSENTHLYNYVIIIYVIIYW